MHEYLHHSRSVLPQCTSCIETMDQRLPYSAAQLAKYKKCRYCVKGNMYANATSLHCKHSSYPTLSR